MEIALLIVLTGILLAILYYGRIIKQGIDSLNSWQSEFYTLRKISDRYNKNIDSVKAEAWLEEMNTKRLQALKVKKYSIIQRMMHGGRRWPSKDEL